VICVASPAAAQAPFHLEEATIFTIRSAFASGQLTCTQLTKLCLDRIEAYNLKGPSLHAIINNGSQEGVTADAHGNIYGSLTGGMALKKYVRGGTN